MRVFITGATGFIGRALVPSLSREGHAVVVWARAPHAARARLGADVEIADARGGASALAAAIDGCDAVINLAGEPLMAGRWTAARRRMLRDSRVETTAAIVRAIELARVRPRVLVSGSAVGFYGDRGSEPLDERASPDASFLSVVCQEWEAAAAKAVAFGVRVVSLRTGVVLGREGGALAQMLPAFRAGLGGPVGGGRQYLPWIHLHDLVGVVLEALVDDRYAGPVNGVAPDAVTNEVFSRALGAALHRPVVLRVPAFALRLAIGEASSTLLASQRVEPAMLRRCGFTFQFPMLTGALADVTGGTPVVVTRLGGPVDAHGSEAGRRYLHRHPPTFELRTTTRLPVSLDQAFAFFSKADNLGLLTPSAMRFVIHERPPHIGEGVTIGYRLRMGPVPIAWQSRIAIWQPGVRFVDLQEQGPYRCWWHEHAFRAEGDSTLMDDRVCYAPPLGAIGRLANRLFIVPTLRRIFQYRADVIRLRFGA